MEGGEERVRHADGRCLHAGRLGRRGRVRQQPAAVLHSRWSLHSSRRWRQTVRHRDGRRRRRRADGPTRADRQTVRPRRPQRLPHGQGEVQVVKRCSRQQPRPIRAVRSRPVARQRLRGDRRVGERVRLVRARRPPVLHGRLPRRRLARPDRVVGLGEPLREGVQRHR